MNWNKVLHENTEYYKENKLYCAEKINEANDYFSFTLGKWIPVEYGLPKYGEEVLVTTDTGEIKKAKLLPFVRGDIKIADSWTIEGSHSIYEYKVVAWTILPNYEEGE